MRRTLAALLMFAPTAAMAADLGGPKANPPLPATVQEMVAKPSCYVEASAGKNITSSRVSDDIAGPVTFSADGLIGGAGLGCDVRFGGAVIGALARYDLSDVKTAIAGDTIKADGAWTVALRAGIKINDGTLAYALLGYSGTEIRYADLKTSPNGIMYGAGLEVDAFIPNLALFAEWNHVTWDKASDGLTSIRPDSDIFRVGLKLKFGVLK